MPNINARSPFIVSITSSTQVLAKIELTIWNLPNSIPALYTYLLTKGRVSTTNNTIEFDISHFLREYMSFNNLSNQASMTSPQNSNTLGYCLFSYKKYTSTNSTTWVQSGLTETGYAFDGYGYYVDGANPTPSLFHLDQGTYYYSPDNITLPPLTFSAGKIRIVTGLSTPVARYTKLVSPFTITNVTLSFSTIVDVNKVISTNQQDGNKLELLFGNVVQATWYFKPICESKYTPVIIDFVNRHGALQREYAFKSSNDTFKVENTDYNLMQSDVNYNLLEGQKRIFNANGQSSIKVNTGWVDEDWKNTLKQLMLSEKIYINQLPCKINTKSTELFKHINTKQINYALEFDYNYDEINNVI